MSNTRPDVLAVERQSMWFHGAELDEHPVHPKTLNEQGVGPNAEVQLRVAPLGPGAMVRWFGGAALGLTVPLGLAVDVTRAPARLAICDSQTHRVLCFRYPVLQLAFKHGVANRQSPLPEHANHPHACALTSCGSRWYIADTGNNRVLVLDAETGAVEATLGAHAGLRAAPRGIALAQAVAPVAGDVRAADERGACMHRGAAVADRLWVSSSTAHTVQCFDLGGRAPRLVLELGDGAGASPARVADADTLRWPMGIACFDGLVFVADRGHDRVQVFDERTGTHRHTIVGPRGGRLVAPEGVGIDRRRAVLYVCDTGNSGVCAFDARAPFRFRGRLREKVDALANLTVDESNGEVLCTDARQNRVLVFNGI